MSRKFQHNKKRNPALLYEFLIGHVSKCLVNNNRAEAEKAMAISKKYFAKGKPLHEELRLFKDIFETQVESRHSAQKIVDEVCLAAQKLNSRNLDSEKSKLIKEINHTFNDSKFYSHKVKNYTVFASVQTLLSESRNKKKGMSGVQRTLLESAVCDYLVSEDEPVKETLEIDSQYNNVVYKFVVKRFHEKYANKLSEGQRKLLNHYVMYTVSKDDSSIKKELLRETKNIKSKLLAVKDVELNKDLSLMENLSECYKRFTALDIDTVNETTVLEVLKYMHLVEEIES